MTQFQKLDHRQKISLRNMMFDPIYITQHRLNLIFLMILDSIWDSNWIILIIGVIFKPFNSSWAILNPNEAVSRHLKAFRILEHARISAMFSWIVLYNSVYTFTIWTLHYFDILSFSFNSSSLKGPQRPRTCLRLFRPSCTSGEPCTKLVD